MTTQEALREKLEELYWKRKQLEELLEHPGWKLVDSMFVQRMAMTRQAMFDREINSLDDSFVVAGSQRTVREMQLAHSFPRIIIDEVDVEMIDVKRQIAEMEDAGRSDSADA